MRVEKKDTEITVHLTMQEAWDMAEDGMDAEVGGQLADELAVPFTCPTCGELANVDFVCENAQCEDSPSYDPEGDLPEGEDVDEDDD